MNKNRQKILIADDSEMNRSILTDMLGDEFDIIEAADGAQAVAILQKYGTEIALVLLDIVMPEMDGFDVLVIMNKYHWIDDVPVIMISAENASSYVERSYELGVTDYISRPFDALIVHRRVINTILLYAKQKRLIGLVADQIYEKEKSSSLMITILSHIVEFRNGESGLHVLHINTLTEFLLKRLLEKTDQYHLNRGDISLISMASALHDIGKIAIPEGILNKPGKLTKEEFDIMKTHSVIGASMLEGLPFHQNEPLVKVAYEICRWHHERYDGNGYPDGLSGEDIPISAQIVALADVYDALTSDRVYKKAYSHEVALQMILDGECGTFNPLLLECLLDVADVIKEELKVNSLSRNNRKEMRNVSMELLRHEELSASERTLRLLEHERTKYQFFASMSQEIQFEFTNAPPMVSISEWGARKLGIQELIMDPHHSREILTIINKKNLRGLSDALIKTIPEDPVIQFDCEIMIDGKPRWNRFICRAIWSSEEPPQYLGAIGKVVDIHEEHIQLVDLKHMASHDALTGLLNHSYAKKVIQEKLQNHTNSQFVLAIFDLDYFKSANDRYGHIFGDQVLQYMAEKLKQTIRSNDIVARVGGDEFLIFLEYKTDIDTIIQRIFHALNGSYSDFSISISMGIAETGAVGRDYEILFHRADQALYAGKRRGRGQYCFYDDSMKNMFSVISAINSDSTEVTDS